MHRHPTRFAAFLLLLAVPAQAKVVFTGYGDFQANAHGRFWIDAGAATQTALKFGSGALESRGFSLAAVGLFATTSLDDRTRVLMDVTYRDIGVNARTIRLQYAFVERDLLGGTVRGGKITLPFGYYNQNRFYPFQRPSISVPVFQGGILGLPMSDLGASGSRPFELGEATLKADVFAVNGFGPVPGSSTTLRNASVPGGLAISGNVGSADANHRVALGGRVDLSHSALKDSSVGASYYRGEWGGSGQLLQLASAHVHGSAAGFDLLTEYLLIVASGDEGMLKNVGSKDWRTDGMLAVLDYRGLTVRGKPFTPWVRFEDYFTHGGSPGLGREAVWSLNGGAAVRLVEGVDAKIEGSTLYYRLPFQNDQDLKLRGYSVLLGLALTY